MYESGPAFGRRAIAERLGGQIDAAAAALVEDQIDDREHHPHDLLLVSDERESSSVEGMKPGAVRSRVLRSEGPGHGVALLGEEGVREALLAWLVERVRR
jgi:hypothetical protein